MPRLLRGAILGLLATALAAGCTPGGGNTAPTGVVVPAETITVQPWTGDPKDLRETVLLKEPSGDVWMTGRVSGDKNEYVVCGHVPAAKVGQTWEVLAPVKTIGTEVAMALDGRGRPVVIWSDYSDVPGEQVLLASCGTDRGWTLPVRIATMPSQTDPLPSVCTGTDGRVHVAYHSPLEPREEYSRGLIIVDGVYPSKCFHLYLEGARWTQAQPTTGRGRFDVYAPHISSGLDGRIRIRADITDNPQFGTPNRYKGVQTWDGRKWSPFVAE